MDHLRSHLGLGIMIAIIAISLPITIALTQKPQEVRQQAQEPQVAACKPLSLPLQSPVLAIAYYPRDVARPEYLDQEETGWGGNNFGNLKIADWERMTEQMVSQGKELVSDATRYHGYKDPTSSRFIEYSVLDNTIHKYYTPIPRGHPTGGGTTLPHYRQILLDHNICDLVDNRNVKEVWMYGYHSSKIVPDESRMSSIYGDVSNSYPKELYIADEFKLPICNKAYVLYNFTYQPTGDPGNNLHNRIHQIENVVPFIEGQDKWPPNPPVNTALGASTFWGDYAEYLQRDPRSINPDGTRAPGYKSSCGNGHITPNWSNSSTKEYIYDNRELSTFNCETWHPDESKTTYITASCERWGCTDKGFYKWFMQNIPGYKSDIEYQGQKMKNWWEFMYDFNASVEIGRSLYGDSLFCDDVVTEPTPATSSKLYLSDLEWTSMKNQWGPVEKDLSNGENAVRDGKTLTLNTVTYPKGLGVHANSTIKYSLVGRQCSEFKAVVGIDDEVGNKGSMIFQVQLDGVVAYDSGVVTGTSESKAINLSVVGKNEITLLANYNGDFSYDHGDWADAHLVCGGSIVTPIPTAFVTQVPPTVTPTLTPTRVPTATPIPTSTPIPTPSFTPTPTSSTGNQTSITILSPSDSKLSGQQVNIITNASSPVDISTISIQTRKASAPVTTFKTVQTCTNSTTCSYAWKIVSLPAGNYEIKAIAVDSQGNSISTVKQVKR